MGSTGRILVAIGAVVVGTGLLLMAANALGLGKLPGDFSFRRGNVRVYLPLATCILLSVVLSLALAVFSRRR